jgi:cation diffusion facilitator CzcD-associated flavoprotein CzcO
MRRVSHPIDVDVLIVGAGITGIYQLYRCRESGFATALVEAGDGAGGTWFWNRYPGARFDSESYTYGYFFSPELFDEWRWEEHFAGQPEIERYINHVVDRFDLRRSIRFGARVAAATWDTTTSRWLVEIADGTNYRARILVSATGVLSVPFFPDVPGRDDFAGVSLHTGLWPDEPIDLREKRVAVVGTGSSGVQVVPAILDDVAELTVYQRTANWCTPLNNRPITAAEQAELRAGFEALRQAVSSSVHGFHHEPSGRVASAETAEQRREFFEQMWRSPGFMKLTANYVDLLLDDDTNAQWCDFLADKIRSIVHDPALAEVLIPADHRFGSNRPPFVTNYYESFNDPKVSLVNLNATPITRVFEHGIETANGAREFDVIIWATGFDFGTGALNRMGIVGCDSRTLVEAWSDGPSTFLGLCAHGFPNLFFPGGPHAAAGNNPRYNGDQVDFVTETLTWMRANEIDALEVCAEAERRWTDMIDTVARQPPAFGAGSYYFGTNVPGKPRRYLLNSAGRPKLFREFQRVRDTSYSAFELTPSRSA